MNMRRTTLISAVLLMIASSGFSSHITAQVQARADGQWVMPRTADDRPDLQGNWTNATITPIQRRRDQDAVYSPEEASRLEGGRAARTEALNQPSDPDRVAPPVGGDGSTGAAGGVGGYNYFWIDAGDRVAMFDGEPRLLLSLIQLMVATHPELMRHDNGWLKPLNSVDSLASMTILRTGPSLSVVWFHSDLTPVHRCSLTTSTTITTRLYKPLITS